MSLVGSDEGDLGALGGAPPPESSGSTKKVEENAQAGLQVLSDTSDVVALRGRRTCERAAHTTARTAITHTYTVRHMVYIQC